MDAKRLGNHQKNGRLHGKKKGDCLGGREGTLVADVRWHAMLGRRQNVAYQDPYEIIEYMNEMQKGLMAAMERTQASFAQTVFFCKC